MQKKALPVRVDLDEINRRADVIAEYAGTDRAKVLRSALHTGLAQLSSAPEAMTPDECFMMIHRDQELK